MSNPTSRGISIGIDAAMLDRLQQLADVRKCSVDTLMQEALVQFLERDEKRERFRKDTIMAWEESQNTGLHASAEEVEAWLESWGGEKELPAPECHR